jgi:hypothetical protein
MSHRNLGVVGSECTSEGGRGIALYDDQVWILAVDDRSEAVEGACGDLRERLSLGQDGEIVMGFQSEEVEDLVEDTAVLGGHD